MRWIGWNTGAYKVSPGKNEDDRLRTLVSLVILNNCFLRFPKNMPTSIIINMQILPVCSALCPFLNKTFIRPNIFMALEEMKTFLKVLMCRLTAGWINKQNKNRPYVGLDIQRYLFYTQPSVL